ncbi:G-type lectin S-receptor-like serine/threonine-protein kinase [Dichanthelium oligosanthes]|uniref:G-type lectin S-receptor-like serine/threonine-protein kinase n=1 Tax=Dichanthelium oligosanthes TaxID=888268 RepID=A0A1E5W665_9POAL|nr:G-type lectin S-receptor-like serine/threonine-protein kinase [Dichanthelium oligosanthes]
MQLGILPVVNFDMDFAIAHFRCYYSEGCHPLEDTLGTDYRIRPHVLAIFLVALLHLNTLSSCNARDIISANHVLAGNDKLTSNNGSSLPGMSGEIENHSRLHDYQFIDNDKEVYFTYTVQNDTLITFNLLDVSGRSKQMVWLESSQVWLAVDTEPKAECEAYAVCGPFTICKDYMFPLCSCMKGFSIAWKKDWELGDHTGGCIRNVELDCGREQRSTTSSTDKFYSISSIKLPSNASIIEPSLNKQECVGRTGRSGALDALTSRHWNEAAGVKRLDGAHQGEKQFRAEESSIGIIQHINLISLGVAKGLAYLHHSRQECIIHCDIKPQNILLDPTFVPKVADFGMAKFLGRDFSRVLTTVRETQKKNATVMVIMLLIFLCRLQDNEFDRPTMGEAAQILEGVLKLNMPPIPRIIQAISATSDSARL